MEIWKDVAGWEGLYQVSNLGRAKVLARTFKSRNRWGDMMRHNPEKLLSTKVVKGNVYPIIGLTCGDRKERVLLHRLICETFNGPPPTPKHHCAHNDGDPTNNRADNLRWATVKENSEDTRRHGNLRVGERSNLSKLTAEQVLEIRARASRGEGVKQIAEDYGFTREGISAIVRRKNWRHI